MDQGFESQVKQTLLGIKGWASIDELVAIIGDQVKLPTEFTKRAIEDNLKRVIRRQIKMFKDGDGLSQWESIERANEDGDTERVYKQLELFTKDDYLLAIDNYAGTARYYARKANTLAERCNKTHRTRIPPPLPGFGNLSDSEEKTA